MATPTTDPQEPNMKTTFISYNKDNIAISTLIIVSLFVIVSGLFNSNKTVASDAVTVQRLDTIVVTASRTPVTILDTMVVTASRKNDRA